MKMYVIYYEYLTQISIRDNYGQKIFVARLKMCIKMHVSYLDLLKIKVLYC